MPWTAHYTAQQHSIILVSQSDSIVNMVPHFGISILVAAAIAVQFVCAVPLTDFFPFGYKFGDEVLLPGNNVSASKELSVSFPFHGRGRKFITVLTDGQIHLKEDKRSQSSTVMVYPFSGDVDTTSIGEVFYRETDDPQLLKRAAMMLQTAFPKVDDPSPTSLFIATWFYVGYFEGHNDKTNTFQCLLATNGSVSYAMFFYVDGHMQWTAYDTDTRGEARMGFESEKRVNIFYTSDADKDYINDIDLTSNSGTPGQWIFMDDGWQIQQPTTAMPIRSFVPEFIERRFERALFSGDGPPIEPPTDSTLTFVGLVNATISITEGQSQDICVQAESVAQPAQPIQISLSVGLVSASLDDFVFTPVTASILNVPFEQCFTVTANPDLFCEGDESFLVVLSFVDDTFIVPGLCQTVVTILEGTVLQQGVDFSNFFSLGAAAITLPPTDDGSTALIPIPLPFFPFDTDVLISVSVSGNGAISFQTQWPFFNPESFPTTSFVTRNAYVVAPFWTDIDTRNRGSITYNTHTQCTPEGSALLGQVSSYINNNLQLTQQPFSGRWMLIATWDSVHPFPDGISPLPSFLSFLADFVELENTFQAIVITDGLRSYAVFLYDCDLMEWSGRELTATDDTYATMGFNAFGRNFLNLPFTGTPMANQIACANLPCGQKLATYVIPLAEISDALQQQRLQCLDLYKTDIDNFSPLPFFGQPCPCTFFQALTDIRYVRVFSAGLPLCFTSRFPDFFGGGGGPICCYNPFFGFLVQSGDLISTVSRFHAVFNPFNFLDFDLSFRQACCSNGAGACALYLERRPQRSCFGYRPIRRAWWWGDPHFRTVDERRYTFNGLGEFVVFNVTVGDDTFVVQGRTQRVGINGTATEDGNATEFCRFALGIRDRIAVELRQEDESFQVLVNGIDMTSSLANINDTFTSTNGDVQITQIDNGEFQVVFNVGLVEPLGVLIRQSGGIPNAVVELNDEVFGLTRGLLGNFNDNATDDFILRNGTTLSNDSMDRSIHFDFGRTWQITQNESLFTYEAGQSVDTFDMPDYEPAFLDEVVGESSPAILEACGNDRECVFDAILTESVEIGMATRFLDEDNTEVQVISENNPPSLNGNETFLVNLNELSTYVFTATDTNEFTVAALTPLPEGSSLSEVTDNNYEFSITLEQVSPFSLGFMATDLLDASATLEPQVQICACQNGGNCTLDGITDLMASTIILNCICPQGYTGQFCESDIDGCVTTACFPGVVCTDNVAPADGATCGDCPVGFAGDGLNCFDIDECTAQDDDCEQNCTNTMGSFACSCMDGFTEDNNLCLDIDECSGPNDCQQICTNNDGSFECACQPGFELANNGLDCNVMAGSECIDRGPFCSDSCFRILVGDPATTSLEFCSCLSGFQLGMDGLNCENVDECQFGLCDQNCMDNMGSFVCTCNAGFVLDSDGRSCNDVDECMLAMMSGSTICNAGETCVNTVGSFECVCPPGTEFVDGMCQVAEISFVTTSVTVEEDETSATVCVNISGGLLDEAAVVLSSADGSALAGEDYVAITALPITFESSPSQICIDVCVVQDRDVEATSEQFSLQLFSQQFGGNIIVGIDVIFVFILDRTAVEVAFSQSTYEAVECDGCNVTVCVDIRMAELRRSVFVSLSTMDGMATAGLDYESVSNLQIQFDTAPDTFCIDIPILPDALVEGSEGFLVSLESSDPRVELTVSPASVVIADSSVATLAIEFASYGGEEGTMVHICVLLTSGTLLQSISATLSTQDITATSPDDYDPVIDEQLVFNSNIGIVCVYIAIASDVLADPDEQFAVLLASDDPSVEVANSLVIVTINETSPVIEIGFSTDEAFVGEDEENVTVCISVVGNIPSGAAVYFLFIAEDGTAIAGQDYNVLLVSAHFDDSVDNSTVDMDNRTGYILLCLQLAEIIDNTDVDGDVYFSFSGEVTVDPSYLAVEVAQASIAIHIIDDDTATAYLTRGSFSISESDAVRGLALYVCAFLSGNHTRDIVLTLSTRSDTAIEGVDFPEQNQYLLYTPDGPSTRCTGFIIYDDSILENVETFFIDVSSDDPAFNISRSPRPSATVSIVDDDTVTIGFNATEYIVMEDSPNATIVVEVRSGQLERPVQVNFSTVDGSALDQIDYIGVINETLLFDSAILSVTIVIPLLDDEVFGALIEIFSALLDTFDRDVILDPDTATVNIIENEEDVVAMFTQSVYPGQEGSFVTVCLELMGEAQLELAFNITATDNTATDGEDYESGGVRELTFGPGETVQCVSYELLEDVDLEVEVETFNVTATSDNPIIVIPFPTATVRIEDTTTVVFGWLQAEFFVGEAAPFLIACTAPSPFGPSFGRSITIFATTQDNTAMEGADYDMTSASLDFVSPRVVQCLVITIRDDAMVEGTESFDLLLTSSDPAVTYSIQNATVFINDNES